MGDVLISRKYCDSRLISKRQYFGQEINSFIRKFVNIPPPANKRLISFLPRRKRARSVQFEKIKGQHTLPEILTFSKYSKICVV
jgi:hypothetical protein